MNERSKGTKMGRGLVWLAAFTALVGVGCGGQETEGSMADDQYFQDWSEASDVAEGKTDTSGCKGDGIVVPDQGPFGGAIALTFDDGPEPALTSAILDVLRDHNAPATFFMNGRRFNSDADEALAREIHADEEFLVASHTFGHVHMPRELRTRGEASARAQIEDNATLLESITGERPVLFRFPFGATNCETKRFAEEAGHAIIGWHIDSGDWCYAAGDGYCSERRFPSLPDEHRDDMLGYILAQARRRQGGILLFHDVQRMTAEVLDEVLTRLEEEGYRFVRVDDPEVFPQLVARIQEAAERGPSTTPITEPAGPGTLWRVTATELNVRQGPGTSHPVVASAPMGTVLLQRGAIEGRWIPVQLPEELGGQEGWVHQNFVERIPD